MNEDMFDRAGAPMVANNSIRGALEIIDSASLLAANGNHQDAADNMRTAANYLQDAAERLRAKAHWLSSLR